MMLSVSCIYAKLVCYRRPEGPVKFTGNVETVASTQNEVRSDQRTCACMRVPVRVRVCVPKPTGFACAWITCGCPVNRDQRTRADCRYVVAAYVASGEINI